MKYYIFLHTTKVNCLAVVNVLSVAEKKVRYTLLFF